MMLTTNFSMEEFVSSNTGERLGIDNTPNSAELRANIMRTAQMLERVRTLLKVPIIITSGYRCPALNKAVGGAQFSAHVEGLAADFIAPRYGTPYEVCKRIEGYVEDFGIDQLIYEFTWVHLGLNAEAPRHQLLTYKAGAYWGGIQA